MEKGNPVVDSDGKVQIPEGYKWCASCLALTSHKKGKWDLECVVCGERLPW